MTDQEGSNLKMMKAEVSRLNDAVHKLQSSLLQGLNNEKQLSAAGSLLSRCEYHDVVTERSLAYMCGYPLCSNYLPSKRPRKGRYHISLREHKVYDLHETCMYCSSSCLIESRAFAANLQEKRSTTLNPTKLDQVLKLFEELNIDSSLVIGKNGDLALSGLMIQEQIDREAGGVSLEKWIGSSTAIDGYVPRRDRTLETHHSNNCNSNNNKGQTQGKVESKRRRAQPNVPDMNFTTSIITEDEYSISKTAPSMKGKESKGMSINDVHKPAAPSVKIQEKKSENTTDDEDSALENTISPRQNGTTKVDKNLHLGKEFAAGATVLKSSFKTSHSQNATRSVTWADGESSVDGQNLHKCRELKEDKGALLRVGADSYRFASAAYCARALSQAAEAVISGKSNASDAVSEAGVMVCPPPHAVDEYKSEENDDVMTTDPILVKWPPEHGFSSYLFDSEESWYDSPPEGFTLTLTPFSTMFMVLFSWISSSSLAYIHGKEESFHEEYLSVNGREYPRKIFDPDGISSEIKQTLAGCLSRSLPGLVTELRLHVPLSILEQGMGRLLDTMSFIDPLPPFSMKQWQVILLLFLEALSVSRIPALSPYMLDRSILLPKVLEGAQISVEEFEIMKDLIIPFGRMPRCSTQDLISDRSTEPYEPIEDDRSSLS